MSIIESLAACFRRHSKKHSLPEGCRVYAIGDMHGYDDAVQSLLSQIHTHIQKHPIATPIIVTLGDYVSKGPRSAQTLDLIAAEKEKEALDGIQRVILTGNHEIATAHFMDNPIIGHMDKMTSSMVKHGLLNTLESYGVHCPVERIIKTNTCMIPGTNFGIEPKALEWARQELLKKMPAAHDEILRSSKCCFEQGDYFFVHGGIDPSKPISRLHQHFSTMTGLEGARAFVHYKRKLEMRVVRGHTISNSPYENPAQIGVDTGIYTNGVLTAVVLEGPHVGYMQAVTDYEPFDRRATAERLLNLSSPQI